VKSDDKQVLKAFQKERMNKEAIAQEKKHTTVLFTTGYLIFF
jgi:hypothetical protein